MGSFEEPFRGLPAEIRLIIWEYVALPAINITDVVRDTLNRHPLNRDPDARDDETSCENKPHPCSTHHQLPLNQVVFKSPLQFLAAVMTVNRAVRAELMAVIEQHGLSFQVDLEAPSLPYFLTEQFRGIHTPRIRILRVCPPYWSRYLYLYNSIPERPIHQLYLRAETGTQTQISRPLVEQVEFTIDGRTWSDVVARLTRTHRNTDLIAFLIMTHQSFVSSAAPNIDPDFDVAEELIIRRIARQVVFTITNLSEEQNQIIVDISNSLKHALEVEQIFEHCDVTYGPPRLEAHDMIEVGTCCHQIEFRSKSEVDQGQRPGFDCRTEKVTSSHEIGGIARERRKVAGKLDLNID